MPTKLKQGPDPTAETVPASAARMTMVTRFFKVGHPHLLVRGLAPSRESCRKEVRKASPSG